MKMRKVNQVVNSAANGLSDIWVCSLPLIRSCMSLLLAWTIIVQATAPIATASSRSASGTRNAATRQTQVTETITVFGPERFTRQAGQPTTFTRQFALPAGAIAPFMMQVQNGAPDGSNRIASATVKLNGTEILKQRDFSQNVATINRDVTLTANNTLEVKLTSAPGSYLTITFTATRTVELPPPALESISINRASQGQSLQVSLYGRNTNWSQGQTRASFGGEVSIGGAPFGEAGLVTVTSPTTALVDVVVSPTAALTRRNVRVTTTTETGDQDETVTLSNAFTVAATVPPGSSSTNVITLAGQAGAPGYADGSAITARFRNLAALVVGPDDAIYVADAGNNRVRVLRDQQNVHGAIELTVSTFAGDGTAGYADGTASQSRFNNPQGVAIAPDGAIIVADTDNHRIRRIASDGAVTTVAGDGTPGLQNGTGAQARFNAPRGVAVDSLGAIYVADTGNSVIRVINTAGEVRTAAGDGTVGSSDSPAARFDGLAGVAVDGANVYIYLADTGNHRIRRLDSADTVITIAGAERGFADGSATEARFAEPSGITIDGAGKIVVTDAINSLVRQVDPELATGGSQAAVATLAGTGERGSTDGAGNESQFYLPRGIAVMRSSAIIVADTGNHTLRRILLPPAITSIAPAKARPLATITINGERFDARAPERNTVRFTRSAQAGGGQTIARVTSATRRELTVVVPADVATGDVTVQTDGGTSNAINFELAPAPAPAITNFDPKRGGVGATVTLIGTALRADTGETNVSFTGTAGARLPALVSYSSETEVRVTVPNGAITGSIQLVNAWGIAATAEPFTVEAQQDYQLTVAPSTASAVQRSSATYVVGLNSNQSTFTQLARLSATGLPQGIKTTFEPAQITNGASSTLSLNLANIDLAPGGYPFTINATADVEGKQMVRTASATLNVIAGGRTSLAGRVLNTDSEPVIGAIVSLDGRTTTTDASGSFLLFDITAGEKRPLMIDGRTASAPNRTYPVITEPATVVAGQANVVPFTFYLPPIDVQYEVEVVPGRDTPAGNPRVPGLQMTIPAGANLRNRDGSPVARVSITPLAIDRTPTPLPGNVRTGLVYTSQPGGALTDIPVPVIYPNLMGADPNTRVELYAFNHDTVQWYVYGYGRVSADGRSIVPEIDPNTGRQYGLPDFSWHFPNVGPGGNPGGGGGGPCGGRSPNPVDYATGMKIETAVDISIGSARGSLELSRVYTSDLAQACDYCPFGRGVTHNFAARLTGSFQAGGAGRVVMPEEATGRLFSYSRTDGDGALVFTSTEVTGQLGDVVRRLSNGTLEYRRYDGVAMRFDSTGKLTNTIDRNGNTTALNYTGTNLTRITDAVGRSITLDYDSSNRITKATDPFGRVRRYTYEGTPGVAGGPGLTTVTDPLGNVTRYSYAIGGRLASITDPRGNVIKQVTYDNSGRVTTQKFADGGTERYSYTLAGGIVTGISISDALNRVESKRFNANGYLIGTTDSLGQTSRIERDIRTNLSVATLGPCGCAEGTRQFDARGNITAETSRLGGTIRYEYEPIFNNLTKEVGELGHVTAYAYDTRGNLVSKTDALNQTTTYSYDSYGQLTSVTDPLNHTTRIEYDAVGNVTASINALGERTTMEYDEANRLKSVADPLGRRLSFTYDERNRLTSRTSTAGAVTSYTYDGNSNMTSATDGLGRVWKMSYDAKNRQVSRTDPLGRVTRMTYNTDDELVSITSPSGRTVRFTYDQRGQRTTMIDPSSGVLRFSYDNQQKMVTLADQRGNTTSYTYDELSRPIGMRNPLGQTTSTNYDAAGNITETTDRLGRRTTYSYDALNRVTSISYADARVTYAYDAAGRRTRVDDTQGGSIEWTYDDANRLLSESTLFGTVKYTYDGDGARSSMTVANRTPVTYSYDSAGRPRTITQGAEVFTFTYDELSRLTGLRRPNGLTTTYSYDPVGKIVQLTHGGIEDYRFSYNADGEIESATSLSAAYRLSAEKVAGGTDAANRVAQFGEATHSFDEAGQTLNKTDAQGTKTFQWDARGRLTRATLPSGKVIEYTYDALGRRSSRTVDGATTRFIYDGSDVVLDRGAGGGDVDYINGFGVDVKLRQSSAATGSLYFIQDHLSSTIGLIGPDGNLVERSQYEAFGETAGSAFTRYGYTGRERDDLTELVYYRARWYDPQQGRFLSEDPMRFASGDANLYKYVQNNPVNLTDPSGLDPHWSDLNNGNYSTSNSVLDFARWHAYNAAKTLIGDVGARGVGRGMGGVPGAGEMINTLEIGPELYNTLDKVDRRNQSINDALRCAQGDCSPRDFNRGDGLGGQNNGWGGDGPGGGSGGSGGLGAVPGGGSSGGPGGNGSGGGTGGGGGSGGSNSGGGTGGGNGGGGWFDWLWPRRPRRPPC